MNDTITVFLVDDHPIVRDGLRAALSRYDDIEVIGEADTAASALARITSARPDVALLDINLPDETGIELCRQLVERCPTVRSVMVTSFDETEAVFGAILGGAAGYALKHATGEQLAECIRRVARGESCTDRAAAHHMLERAMRGAVDERLTALTKQEHRVLELLADGLTNREIGARLFVSDKTVKNYVSSILMKLGMSRRSEAAALAARIDERRRSFIEPVGDSPAIRY